MMENVPSNEVKEPEKKEDKLIPSNVQAEMEKLIPYAGTIELTEDQKKILFAPVKDEDVEIRPDGLIYLPWMEYVSRLRDAFGISWAIIPKDLPKFQSTHLYWPFYLMIQGKLAGFAIGEQEYQANNARMTYGDAAEGAKSNALMRLCKGIGISLELWKPSFIRAWKEKHAEEYMDDKGKKKWRKKNGKNQTEETEIVPSEQSSGKSLDEIHTESAKKCAEISDELLKVDNIVHLKNKWAKYAKQWQTDLLPEHFQSIEKLKDELKERLSR